MKSSINFNIVKIVSPLALGALILFGCNKGSNNNYEAYGAVDSLTATFTVTPVPGNDTKFVITNTTQGNCVGTKWDLGKDTSGGAMGKITDTAFYPLAGTYTIKMYALDKRGKLYSATPVSVTTTKSDPAYFNVIKGGNMNPGDDQYWGRFDAKINNRTIWKPGTNVYNANVTIPVTTQANGGIYQAVQVVAKKYRFSMYASFDAPLNSWLEVYIGSSMPADGNDYTEGGARVAFIKYGTWLAYGGTKSFDIPFGASGTYYVVIKVGVNSGGNFGSTGFNVTNIDLHRIQE